MGDLDKVAVNQIDYRGLLGSLKEDKAGGETLEEETIHDALSRYPEDVIVNLCLALEDTGDLSGGKEQVLQDAVEILDHLDTLGMEIRYKS